MIKKKCKQCGKEFILTDSEIKFFEDKNLELPKRCGKCRKENKNKQNNKNYINTELENNINENNNASKSSKNNKKRTTLKSIIATALVVVFLLIGKLFNIPLNWGDIDVQSQTEQNNVSLQFRNEGLWEDHFLKHGNEFGYSSKEEYLKGANTVINSPSSKHKLEDEDGDEVYYDESKNEIVFVSADGYIRTYFKPTEGIDYYNRQ